MTDITNTPDPTVTTLALLIADLYGQLRAAQVNVADRERLEQELNELEQQQDELANELAEGRQTLSAMQSSLVEVRKLKDARIAELEEELAETEEEASKAKGAPFP